MEALLEESTSLYGLAAVLIIGLNATLFWVAGIRLATGTLPDPQKVLNLLRPATGRATVFLNEQLRKRFPSASETGLPPLPPVGV